MLRRLTCLLIKQIPHLASSAAKSNMWPLSKFVPLTNERSSNAFVLVRCVIPVIVSGKREFSNRAWVSYSFDCHNIPQLDDVSDDEDADDISRHRSLQIVHLNPEKVLSSVPVAWLGDSSFVFLLLDLVIAHLQSRCIRKTDLTDLLSILMWWYSHKSVRIIMYTINYIMLLTTINLQNFSFNSFEHLAVMYRRNNCVDRSNIVANDCNTLSVDP